MGSSYGEIGINKNTLHNNTTSISIDEVEINRIVLFDKTSYGNNDLFKYYIGYKSVSSTKQYLPKRLLGFCY